MMSDYPAHCTPLAHCIQHHTQQGIQPSPRAAFILDKSMRDRIVLLDPTLAPLFRRYLQSDDIHRYTINDHQRFLLALPAGWTAQLCGPSHHGNLAWQCIAEHYPALARHLTLFVADRPHHAHIWWELEATTVLPERTQPSITWHAYKNHLSFALTPAGYVSATPWLAGASMWVLGYLNSTPVQRWLNRQKSAGVALAHALIDQVPVPHSLTTAHDELSELTAHAVTLQTERLQHINATIHTLVRNFAPLGATVSTQLSTWYQLDFAGLRNALIKSFKNDIPERLHPQWHAWFDECHDEYQRRERQLTMYEGRINQLVTAHFPSTKGAH